VRIAAPTAVFSNKTRFALSNAPEGLTIKKVTPSRDGGEIVLQCDAKVKPGQTGSLTVTISAGKAVLPAIPFEITQR
jgi:hypothetical protein